ncbi:MAG: protein kinase [Lentisphaeria bacterium]|nr:protein kinase [Lentisphaeria bacterium]
MSDDTAFEDLVESYLEMIRDGTAPEIDEFTHSHPEYAERLADLLPLMVKMEDCAEDTRREHVVSGGGEFPDLSGSDYRLIRKIGTGGMGEVFEAMQVSLDRKVAVKVLSPSLTADPAQREQFENEARVIAMLHHPNIVKIYNAGVSADRCYYAMELINGTGLNRYETSAPREIARLGLQAARALAYAHSCGVLHCDIKPANLLLDTHGEIHIGDFGLAFVLKDAAGKPGKPGMRSGTLRYMAPERLKHGIKSFAGDQYSFGVTLYELITRGPVLQEQNPQKLIDRICAGPLPPLQCSEPDLAAIVNRCIAFDPAARYPGMAEVAKDLDHFLRHEPVSAASTSVFRRFRLWSRRKPAVAALSLLALTAIIAFAVAVTVGYVRTNSALKLAEKNAAAANAALSDIFAHIEHRTPTSSGSELLSRLMPYYQDIAEQRNLPQSEVADMNLLIGTAAMRSGNYPLAENAFRRAYELQPDGGTLNQLAAALRPQGKTVQADLTSRQVIDEYPDSIEAVRARQTLGEYDEAFGLLRRLLQQNRNDPEYLYQYALLLETQSRFAAPEMRIGDIPQNPSALLEMLAKQYPDRMEFSLAFVDLTSRKLSTPGRFSPQDRQSLEQALALADRLLAGFPNTPEVASAAVELHNAHIAQLRRSGDQAEARKEEARLQGMLEILYRSQDAPDEVKETLLTMQMEQLEQMIDAWTRQPTAAVRSQSGRQYQELAMKIRDELYDYHGDRLEEFLNELGQLWSRTGSQMPITGARRQFVQGGRQLAGPEFGRTGMPGRQNTIPQQRTRTRTPGIQQSGTRQERIARGTGGGFMPPAGGEMRPFAPNRSTPVRGGQTPVGGIGRAGRNENQPAAGRTGAESGLNDSAGRNEPAAGNNGAETGQSGNPGTK